MANHLVEESRLEYQLLVTLYRYESTNVTCMTDALCRSPLCDE